ncbi:MAG TPA: AsmA family protein [Terracidiphilus sp.]|nr:AsmA family protein [Terracidiphilus sp.]
MSEDLEVQHKPRTKLWIVLGLVGLVVVLLVVPPLVSINRYKSRITQLVSAAVGRPVRLSGVELRLLPRPGFVLSDLTVQEDPAFGAEPVLHATTVMAAVRLESLWRGRLQISRISVDDASLNLVRAPDGRWNLDSLFRNATPKPGTSAGHAQERPYLEATNSRINIKNGVVKLPYSLVEADASMWQESDGEWRVRLRGRPARTDVTLDLADTGIVRMEATLHPAEQLNRSQVHVDADWREAQLGQLTRLVIGSDEGWRGALTGEVHLDGTAASAKVTARLSAAGVHRAEFAPAAALDFDATCAFTYRYSQRSVQGLECDSPLGNGRARIKGDLPGAQPPRLTVELDRIPAQAALDLLRTMRRRIDPSIEAAGAVSGHMTYDPAAAAVVTEAPAKKGRQAASKVALKHAEPARGALTGSFAVEGLRVSGDALSRPIQMAKMTLEPAPESAGDSAALRATLEIPAGGPSPLAVTARLALQGFEVTVRGTAALARLREFAHAAGSPAESLLSGLAGEPATVDVTVNGPWVPPVEVLLAPAGIATAAAPGSSVHVSGTIALHEANWKADFLANAVMLSAATLHIEDGALRWDPIAFSFGPVKGAATMDVPTACDAAMTCAPKFAVKFGALDAAAAQSALLGAREKGTLLSTLLSRLKLSSATPWPQMEGTAQADSLVAGQFTFSNATAEVKIGATGAEITSFNAGVLGGTVHGKGSLAMSGQPGYTFDGDFSGVNAAQAGPLTGTTWSGGPISGGGHVEMAGYTDEDLGTSAKGKMHFDWRRGAMAGDDVPAALVRFDRWSGDAAVGNGAMTLGENEVQRGGRKLAVQGTLTFGTPAQVELEPGNAQNLKP